MKTFLETVEHEPINLKTRSSQRKLTMELDPFNLAYLDMLNKARFWESNPRNANRYIRQGW